VCLAACVFCSDLGAQERTPFDRPAPFVDSVGPADFAGESVRRVFFELRLAETEPVRGLTFEATVKSSGKKLNLHYTTVVTNGDVSRARVVESNGRYEVAIRLTDEGAAKLTSATARHVGRPVAIVLDGGVVADLIVGRSLGSEIMLSASLTQAEATRIAAGLNKW
jgi:preprotein translocase subunit SecD